MMRVTAIDSYKCGNERHRRVARWGAEHELCCRYYLIFDIKYRPIVRDHKINKALHK